MGGETLSHIVNGFAVALQFDNMLFLLIGTFLGTFIGMLPGIGAAAGISLLLPMTFGMNPITALIMLSGIYYGAMYGNSISAILINTPGTGSAVMTSVDGYPMAQKGRAGGALAISAIASFVAGTIGIVLLSVVAIPLSHFALRFGPAEYFMLMIFGMSAVTMLTGESVAKGMISLAAGLMLASVGIDLQSAQPRFTMGALELLNGIHLVIVIIGLFAIAEVFKNIEHWFKGTLAPVKISGQLWMTAEERKRSMMPVLRGGLIGFLVGVLPGTGGAIATILAYATEKRLSKKPEEFGHGAPEGVAAPEAANNASTCGAFVPLLTLGIPGSGTTAVLLGAFVLYGIQPGPQLFSTHPELVWGLIDSMYLGNIMLLIFNLPLIGLFARILYTPPAILMAVILLVATVGTYSLNNSVFDVYLMLAFGLLGYGFNKLAIPVAPLILALVLGGQMEQSFRQSLVLSSGSLSIFIKSGIGITLLLMFLASILGSVALSRYTTWRGNRNMD